MGDGDEPPHWGPRHRRRRLKALAFDSGPPLVCDEPAATYERASDEHGRLGISGATNRLGLSDKVRLMPGHCDPTVNLYDWYVCIRNNRVEQLWPITAKERFINGHRLVIFIEYSACYWMYMKGSDITVPSGLFVTVNGKLRPLTLERFWSQELPPNSGAEQTNTRAWLTCRFPVRAAGVRKLTEFQAIFSSVGVSEKSYERAFVNSLMGEFPNEFAQIG